MRQLMLMILVVVLVGCGKPATPTQATGTPEPQPSPKVTTEKPKPVKVIPNKLNTDPIVEKEIRRKLVKFTGELTEADLEKVEKLDFYFTQITDAGLKDVAKLKQLKELGLRLYQNNRRGSQGAGQAGGPHSTTLVKH